MNTVRAAAVRVMSPDTENAKLDIPADHGKEVAT